MSTFKFNFSGGDHEDLNKKQDNVRWFQSEEILPGEQIKTVDNLVVHAKMFTYRELEIGHVLGSEAMLKIKSDGLQNAVKIADNDHSDLVTGVYEGGLKIWECTHDLIDYLLDNKDSINLKKADVLDLGCGAGILGIYAFLNGSSVTFQDYNKEILECVTITNVLLNIEEENDRATEITKCKFYSGDWSSFNNILSDSKTYDIILTSETIYNENNYDKLITLFLQRLAKNGVVYVAAKTYYFGVGGGTRQFESSIAKSGLLNCDVCWKSSGGIQREILKITKT